MGIGSAGAKDIAEAAYVYGLPLVMNYGVMYEFVVDKNSGQFKAPFNEIKNETQVYTYKDTAIVTPNSDTPYSFVAMDLRAEPMVLTVPAGEKKRYYSVQLGDGNTFNFGYIGSRATGNAPGDYLVVGPDWKGQTPAGAALHLARTAARRAERRCVSALRQSGREIRLAYLNRLSELLYVMALRAET